MSTPRIAIMVTIVISIMIFIQLSNAIVGYQVSPQDLPLLKLMPWVFKILENQMEKIYNEMGTMRL